YDRQDPCPPPETNPRCFRGRFYGPEVMSARARLHRALARLELEALRLEFRWPEARVLAAEHWARAGLEQLSSPQQAGASQLRLPHPKQSCQRPCSLERSSPR